MDMADNVTEVAPELFIIDTFFAGVPGSCGVFLSRGEKNFLVDSGTSEGVEHLFAGLDSLGVKEVHYILLTHIHLDHSGGAAFIMERYPEARLLVAAKRARHLVDPSRLIEGARRSLGESSRFYGTMRPIPEDRIMGVEDGLELDIGGGRTIEAVYTPGHSRWHFSYLERASGAVFCGDSLGYLFPRSGLVFPATLPPEFEPEESLASAERTRELEPEMLLFPHFGVSRGCRELIEQYSVQLRRCMALAKTVGLRSGPAALAEALVEEFPGMTGPEEERLEGVVRANAAGILQYLKTE